jgi:hypothetical protein
MKKLIVSLFILLLSTDIYGYTLTSGYFSDPKYTSGTLTLSTNHEDDLLSYGINYNLNLSPYYYELESVVVDHFEYDDGKLDVNYSPIEELTYGHGLLLNRMDTLNYQPPFLRNEHCGLIVDYSTDLYDITTFGTFSHLYGAQVDGISFLGLKLGFEFVSDATMEASDDFGRSACGAFVDLPLTDSFSLFAEGATSTNKSDGALAGLAFDYDMIIAFARCEFAATSFNERFIPGYFTTGYDINRVDFSSLEASCNRRYGDMISLDTGILGLFNLTYVNESYIDGGSANSGSILVTPIENLTLSGFVKELSFTDYRAIAGNIANMVGGTMEYRFNGAYVFSINYKKSPPIEDKKPYEATYCSLSYDF